MSKFTKLLKNPSLFLKDALRKRLQGQQPAAAVKKAPKAATVRDVEEAYEAASDRIPTYIFGFSTWKQFMRAWFPDRELHFLPKTIQAKEFDKVWRNRILKDSRSEIFIWGMKVERYVLRFAKENNVRCAHVEDGFIRSIGLGATKTPPFSLTLDYQAPYFDATRPTDLEDLLNTYDFEADPALLERSCALMRILLQTGISKYNNASAIDIEQIYGPKTAKRVLVVGQVESDASIEFGSAKPYTNNDLVMIAALENPDAQIIYKPHPDVLNKHREMVSDPDDVRHLCMVLEQDVPLAQAFETVDHVYTITSQAGFEALMRGIHVTTLGCPFYAGWGLTDERQPNPRRTRKLTVEQVFAAAYLLYPRYFDPVYKMSLTAEQAVERLAGLKKIARPVPRPQPDTNAAGQLEAAPQGLQNDGETAAQHETPTGPVPAFVVGSKIARQFMRPWFADRELHFIPGDISSENFAKSWERRILDDPRAELFIWDVKLESFITRFAEQHNVKCFFLDHGLIPSITLAGTKPMPFSLRFESQAPDCDASRPSDLENLLNTFDFDSDAALLPCAERLIQLLSDDDATVAADSTRDIEQLYGPKTSKRILVLGQAEDDPTTKFGNPRHYTSNDAVMIAALENPGAQIIYRPHSLVRDKRSGPDPKEVRDMCLVLETELPLAQALKTVDHVYTVTSQDGMEALLRGIPVTALGCPFYAGWGLTDDRQPNARRTRHLSLQQLVAAVYLLYPTYLDPVYKTRIHLEQVVERLVSAKSRALLAAAPRGAQAAEVAGSADVVHSRIPTFMFGFNTWKQFLTAWFPERELHFLPIALKAEDFEKKWQPRILKDPRSEFFVWGFKAPDFVTKFAQKHGIKRYFMEDGFIRSIGLGATHTPPFSLSLDSQTPYFDATRPSDMEDLLNTYDFDNDPALIERARRLRDMLVQSGLSKYNHAAPVDVEAIYGPKTTKRVLVVGQVEEDASIKYGCAKPYTNNDLVMIAVMENPGAQVIYKPHPDVLNKHRGMLSDPDDVRHLCMVLEQDVPLAQAFETVDHVYTITSQAGFEALMRGIHVTTLGCPFYAGWGLTDERQPNPRRTRKLTVEQVLAGAYLLYPKYFDPLYKQPISSEQAIERLLALKQMAKPAMPVADEGVEEAAEMMAEQAASSEAEAAAEPSAAQLQAADIKEELLSLRLEIANLRYQLSQHALGNELPGLRADLKKLGLEMQQMRSVEAVA